MAHKPDVNFMRSVYRRCGLDPDREEAFHDYLHSPEFDGNPNEMDFDMYVAVCLDWKANNPSHDKTKDKRRAGRTGQSDESSLDQAMKRAQHRRDNRY